jgi:hypothetical protein
MGSQTTNHYQTASCMKKAIVFLVVLFLVKITQAQITQLPFELPQNIKEKYPFLGEDIYNVEYDDGVGGTGMFVLTVDKDAFQRFVKKRIFDTLNHQFLTNGFYKRDCRYKNSGLCSPDYIDLLDHKLVLSRHHHKLSHFGDRIMMDFNFDHTATVKEVDRRLEGTKGCVKHTDYDHNVPLSTTRFDVDQYYIYNARRASIVTQFEGKARIEIQYNGCGYLLNRLFIERQVMIQDFSFGMNLDFSDAGTLIYDMIKTMTKNTKNIKITENETHYYVYCIREV